MGVHVNKIDDQANESNSSVLTGPLVNPTFVNSLNDLLEVASTGYTSDTPLFNPSEEWLVNNMSVFQDLPATDKENILLEAIELKNEAEEANSAGKAASRVWPETVVRLDKGGLAFFSQLGVARRPDLTHYFIDGFQKNRDALAFSEANQALFADVIPYITKKLSESLDKGEFIVQTDRRICDAPGRSFHARQLLFGTRYLQLPLMWRELTFDLPPSTLRSKPDIYEISLPNWLDDLDMPANLKARIIESGLTQLIFKAPTKGLSLHLGFDYVGEHKMGPLSIAMFKVKQSEGLAIQAALSMVRVKTLQSKVNNSALITLGPSLHGKSTLTIMIELANSKLGEILGLKPEEEEGIYPMNDDIVLLQKLETPVTSTHEGRSIEIPYGIDGTENNLYAVPFNLNRDDDPITYDVLRGTQSSPNPLELLENVPVDIERFNPKFNENPVRNMRMILSRRRLLTRKGVEHVLKTITDGQLQDSVHIPLEKTDRILWQAVMRQNTVIPPLRKLTLEQYIRVLMYGEAVQMGAATGAIGKPYVEYFSDPFIIGLEDHNANMMYTILKEMAAGGLPQDYYVFNTGGVGASSNDEASGPSYKKIPRELTLMLQEAVLRNAIKFEYDDTLGSEVGVAIINENGDEVLDLRKDWLPKHIYGESDYKARILQLTKRRYYGQDSQDKAGILRYTKVVENLIDIDDIPIPSTERELSCLLSFYWNLDQTCSTISELISHRHEGRQPEQSAILALQLKTITALQQGLELNSEAKQLLEDLGLRIG